VGTDVEVTFVEGRYVDRLQARGEDDERGVGEAELHRFVALGDGDRFMDRGRPPFDQVGAAVQVLAQCARGGGSSLPVGEVVEHPARLWRAGLSTPFRIRSKS
jgi:hypothetical protein